jgi:hypothetical protein
VFRYAREGVNEHTNGKCVYLHASMQKVHILQHTIVFLPSVVFVDYT